MGFLRSSHTRLSRKFVYGMLQKRKRCPPLSLLSLGPMVYRYSTGGKPLPSGPSQQRRMMDDSMYPLDAVRPLARALRTTAISWHDANHRLLEKFAEDMTMQEFIDAAEQQRERTLRENARMMAAFMNHDGAGKQMTLGEILERDQEWSGRRY